MALKPSSKCSFTPVNSAFSLGFALYLARLSEFQQPVKGLELALLGKEVGDRVQATIAPEDGYGAFIDELVQHVPLSVFGDEDKPEVGMRFNADTPNGPLSVLVTAVDGDQAVLNGNHPLAGKTINFDVTIENIREAAVEELTHGHPHNAGGCGHHH